MWDDENAFPALYFQFDQQHIVPGFNAETSQYNLNSNVAMRPSSISKIMNYHQKHVNKDTGKEYNYTKIVFIGYEERKKQANTLKNMFSKLSADKEDPKAAKKEAVLGQMESYT